MWKVILNFRNGGTQYYGFPNKQAAEFFFNTVVFKNEDCVNATVVREDEIEYEPDLQNLVNKITSKF